MTLILFNIDTKRLPPIEHKIKYIFYYGLRYVCWGLYILIFLMLVNEYQETHPPDLAIAIAAGIYVTVVFASDQNMKNKITKSARYVGRYIPYFIKTLNSSPRNTFKYTNGEVMMLLKTADPELDVDLFYNLLVKTGMFLENYTFGTIIKNYHNQKYTFTLKWGKSEGFYLEILKVL